MEMSCSDGTVRIETALAAGYSPCRPAYFCGNEERLRVCRDLCRGGYPAIHQRGAVHQADHLGVLLIAAALVLQYSGIGCENVDHTKQTVAHAPPPRPGVPDEVGERNDLSALPCMRHTRQPWTPRRWRSQRHRESSLWFCEFGRR